jgi:hypothetical protein
VRAFANGERRPHARTLKAIERALWIRYDEPAEPANWMAAFVERCGLDPADPLCRALVAIDDVVNERERELAAELRHGRWPSRRVTEAAFQKARQRARATAK